MRVGRVLLVAGVTSFAFCIVVPGAGANYFGPEGEGCCHFPDNAEHTIHYEVVGNQSYRDAFDHIFNHLDNGTLMTTTKVTSATSVTDVRMFANYFAGVGYHGEWDCLDLNSAGECETGKLLLNRGDLDGRGQHAKDHVACHEMGHSTGLSHAYQLTSCMEQGVDEPKWLGDHDKEHINDRYN